MSKPPAARAGGDGSGKFSLDEPVLDINRFPFPPGCEVIISGHGAPFRARIIGYAKDGSLEFERIGEAQVDD